jgi:hypothetical protein
VIFLKQVSKPLSFPIGGLLACELRGLERSGKISKAVCRRKNACFRRKLIVEKMVDKVVVI